VKQTLHLSKALIVTFSLLGGAELLCAQDMMHASVRAGVHDTFERVVFDWPRRVDYTLATW
jgi:hypothetical protein